MQDCVSGKAACRSAAALASDSCFSALFLNLVSQPCFSTLLLAGSGSAGCHPCLVNSSLACEIGFPTNGELAAFATTEAQQNIKTAAAALTTTETTTENWSFGRWN